MQTITTLTQLDAQLGEAEAASKRSQDEFRKILDGFVLDPSKILGQLPRDPGSEAYRLAQMQFYELIAGAAYKTANEATPFDHAHMLRWPFPYSSRSPSVVGDYLMTYGNLIKTMNLDRDARILEIGSGFGPLTFHLASMGHHVTCVDVHEPLLNYVRERTQSLPGTVETLLADMNELDFEERFDAVIFFESFHHGADHRNLLGKVADWLEDDGVLVLAGEPIVPKGSVAVPYPWGIRLDGLSLWCIRRYGWLELGFQQDYLRAVLEETGWSVLCKPNNEAPTMGVWLAQRASTASVVPATSTVIASWAASDSRLQTQVGIRDAATATVRSTGEPGYLMYGPYCTQGPGFYEVQWEGLVRGSHASGRVDVAHGGGLTNLRAAGFKASPDRPANSAQVIAHLGFKLTEQVKDLEFRLQVDADVFVDITRVVLRKR